MLRDIHDLIISLVTDAKHTRWIAPLLILGEAALCFLIITYTAYTEIDYSTYMVQVHKYLRYGERNYAKLDGPTGPLVYPAMHVWIYSALYKLTVTVDRNGEIIDIDVPKAQLMFVMLYLITVAVVIACYRRVNAPPWLLAPLVLSKRLHSIFMLRLFNDGFASFFLWLTIYAMHRRYWHISALLFSFGVGVKMSILLAAPAAAIIIAQAMDQTETVYMGFAAAALQLVIASPFIESIKGGDMRVYVKRAFQFSRMFLFKWTVNWKFVGEELFLSREFATGLLLIHLSLLAMFIHVKWTRVSSSGSWDFFNKYIREITEIERKRIEERLTPTFVMDAMLGAMVIGLLCARSLHYQFYAYVGWATPYLLWRESGSMALTLGIWAAQEWAWLVYPSTDVSSMVVVGCLMLQVAGAFFAQPLTAETSDTQSSRGKAPEQMEEVKDDVQ